jgi:glutamine synthetase
MREGTDGKNGLQYIIEACNALCDDNAHVMHMEVYGVDNQDRMIGSHETASADKCTWGYSDRSCSIRVPLGVVKDKCGYLEDRRPASNHDPYLVTTAIVNTTILHTQRE